MDRTVKLLIVAMVIGLVGLLLALPLGTKFAPTTEPEKALTAAKAAGRPVFLEFYASW